MKQAIYIIADDSTAFGEVLASGDFVFQQDESILYKLEEKAAATDTLSTINKQIVADGLKLDSIEVGAQVNVNADWDAVSGDSEILNKPTDVTDLSVHVSSELSDGADLVKNTGASTDNALTRFDGATGKVIQNSIGKIDDDGNLSEIKDTSTETITIDSAVQMSYDSVNQSLKFNFI